MTRKEAALLGLVVAAAFVAAFSFRAAAHPADRHDPRHAADYERACEALPLLRAVRVRSDRTDAAQRIEIGARGEIEFVVDPARAQRFFRSGALLYATHAELEAVRAAVLRGEVPAALPDVPDIGALFFDRRGPYACDVVLAEKAGLDLIDREVPDARLSGEPVARAAEREAVRDLPRALVLALLFACGYAIYRREGDAERRLLAALLPLAALGSLRWGVDASSLFALVLVAASPRGPHLVAGGLCLLFPSLLLKRLGAVFLLGGLIRWRRPAASHRPRPIGLAALAAAAGVLALLPGPDPPPQEVPAAAFVAPAGLKAAAQALRAEGVDVVGDEEPVAPDPDKLALRLMGQIYQRAEQLSREDERFVAVRKAAARESMHWPRDLKHRLKTTDGRRVLWAQQPGLAERDEFMSADIYRRRGDVGLRRDGRFAGLLLLVVTGLLARATGRRPLWSDALIAAAAVVLVLAERAALPVTAETAFPLVVMAGRGGSAAVALGLLGAVMGMPAALFWPALGIALAAAGAWLSRPRPRS